MTDEIKNYLIVHKDDLRTALFWFDRAIGNWKHSQSAEEPMDKNTIATYRRLAEQYERACDAAPRDMLVPSDAELREMQRRGELPSDAELAAEPSEAAPRAGSLRELHHNVLPQYSYVKLIEAYSVDGLELPSGAEGTIVDILAQHNAYMVEFHPPHQCVETVAMNLVEPDAPCEPNEKE